MNTVFGFQHYLVLEAIASGACTFSEIAHKSGGLFASDLIPILDDLILSGNIQKDDEHFRATLVGEKNSDVVNSLHGNNQPILPEPHPGDFDWRFSENSSQLLIRAIKNANFTNGNILLIGTPSLFQHIINEDNDANVTLIDYNIAIGLKYKEFLENKRKIVNHDLLSGSLAKLDNKYAVVACDPPWYPEYYRAFLAQAAQALEIGGTLFVSLLPLNTRPNATEDRWDILQTAHSLGLDVQYIHPEVIRYKTPIFEQDVLSTHIHTTLTDWRPGDLAVFRKALAVEQTQINQAILRAKHENSSNDLWLDYLIHNRKIKLRGPFDDPNIQPQIVSIEPNDILPTVSRRYDNRMNIDLWLWNNRVFGVRGKVAFAYALSELTGYSAPQWLVKPVYVVKAFRAQEVLS